MIYNDDTPLCWAQDPATGARCDRLPHDDETHEGSGAIWKDWDHEPFSSAMGR